MGEKKGYLFTLVFFIGIIVPAIFMFGVDALNQSAFTKTTAEVGEMVKEEGGVTSKVAETVNELQRKGYEIRFTNNGSNVTSAVPYGTTIVAHYKYNYHAGFFPRELNVSNKLEILKRDSVGSGNIKQGGVIKTITVNSDEIEKADHVQTWNIPYLKSIRNITSNSGSAHVVNRQGENVTISMNNGSPSRQELIENGEIEDRKYVEGIDHEYYEDAEGYKGILEKYLVRGSLIEEKTKYIEKHNEENYADAEGYTGKLDRYFVGGNLHPEHTKEVSEKLTSDVDKSAQQKNVTELVTSNEDSFADSILYNKDGYKGTINKKGNSIQRLISGEYIPAHTKYTDGQTSENYNKDGYVGKLEKYVVSGEYIPSSTETVIDTRTSSVNSFPATIIKDNVVLMKDGSPTSVQTGGTYIPEQTKTTSKIVEYIARKERLISGCHGSGCSWNQNSTQIIYTASSSLTFNYNEGGFSGVLTRNSDIPSRRIFDAETSHGRTPPLTANEWTIDYYYNNATYSGTVKKPGSDTRTYQYTQKYKGTKTTSPIDTRIYAYRGYVTKPESDTRVYEYDQLYEGTVNQDTDILFPEIIEYDKDGYKGTLAKDGEVTENLVSGEYVPYDEKYVENEESPDYNVDGYVGTLERYVSKGEFVPEDTKEAKKSLTSETYVPLMKKNITEIITSDKNEFEDSIEYKKDGFEGTLYKYGVPNQILVSGELTPAVMKEVTKTQISDNTDFAETIEYDEDGFTGTLYKDRLPIPKLISGDYIPSQMTYVDNQESPYYKKDGYSGLLESYVVSGSPADSQIVQTYAKTDSPTWHKNVTKENSYTYNDGIYSGELLFKSDKWIDVPQSVTVDVTYTQYSTDPNAAEFKSVNYDYVLNEIVTKYGPNNPEGMHFVNPTIQSYNWNEPIQIGSFNEKGQDFGYKREATVIILVDGFLYEALYEGNVSKSDDRVYKYRGFVSTPEIDTRVYEYHQNYTGEVINSEVDTREFVYEQAYEGEVKQEGIDTFPEFVEYLEDNYVGTLTKDGEVRYELASGTLTPYHEKYVDGQNAANYNVGGYVGTLERYVASGTYTPSQTLSCSLVLDSSKASYLPATTVDNQCLTVNGNTNYILYSGTGNLTYSKSRTYTERRIATFNSQILSTNDLTNDAASSYASYFTSVPSSNGLANPGPITLSWLGSSRYEVKVQNGQTFYYVRPIAGQFDYDHQFAIYTTTYTIPAQDTRVYKYRGTVRRAEVDTRKYHYVQDYKGMVTKPESDTREYKYRGTVRRPESDTRKYEYIQSYKGDVTKPESDTREYAYHGNVSKPAEDTREYLYRGEVVKQATSNTGETKPYYQYEITIEYEAWQ